MHKNLIRRVAARAGIPAQEIQRLLNISEDELRQLSQQEGDRISGMLTRIYAAGVDMRRAKGGG
ncbi:MAG: hypothetical protein M3082_06485 [Candidatus Dormibacteraeota bacterium]|nr:hypothetical protein [Candidatus Dormibacteraeota bacterium]